MKIKVMISTVCLSCLSSMLIHAAESKPVVVSVDGAGGTKYMYLDKATYDKTDAFVMKVLQGGEISNAAQEKLSTMSHDADENGGSATAAKFAEDTANTLVKFNRSIDYSGVSDEVASSAKVMLETVVVVWTNIYKVLLGKGDPTEPAVAIKHSREAESQFIAAVKRIRLISEWDAKRKKRMDDLFVDVDKAIKDTEAMWDGIAKGDAEFKKRLGLILKEVYGNDSEPVVKMFENVSKHVLREVSGMKGSYGIRLVDGPNEGAVKAYFDNMATEESLRSEIIDRVQGDTIPVFTVNGDDSKTVIIASAFYTMSKDDAMYALFHEASHLPLQGPNNQQTKLVDHRESTYFDGKSQSTVTQPVTENGAEAVYDAKTMNKMSTEERLSHANTFEMAFRRVLEDYRSYRANGAKSGK